MLYHLVIAQQLLIETIHSLNSKSIVKYIMESVITKLPSTELFKEDNQTTTEASSQFALDSPSFHQLNQDTPNEQEPKREQTKLKYRKLKQKLNSIGFQHDDKCVVVKDFTSTKKQRIMKLALDIEKQIKVQNRDYQAMEVVCREIMKIIEAKRELDLQLLRQSRFVPALFELMLKIPSLHKAELSQALRGLEISIKILYIFTSVSVNRQYLILTNRLNGLISFLSWSLGRQQRKSQNYLCTIHYFTFKIINSLLMHKSREQDTNNIISTTIQLILCSPILKKIRFSLLEQFMQDQMIAESETVLELLRFTLFVLRFAIPKFQPDYIHFNQNNKQPLGNQTYLLRLTEFLVQFCFSFFIQLKQVQSLSSSSTVPQSYPTIVETALLLTLKIANCCFETALSWLRKSMIQTKNQCTISLFLVSCSTIVSYCKHEMQQYNDNSQAKMLLNQIIILLAYLALDDPFVQRKAYEIGLLDAIHYGFLPQISLHTYLLLSDKQQQNQSQPFPQRQLPTTPYQTAKKINIQPQLNHKEIIDYKLNEYDPYLTLIFYSKLLKRQTFTTNEVSIDLLVISVQLVVEAFMNRKQRMGNDLIQYSLVDLVIQQLSMGLQMCCRTKPRIRLPDIKQDLNINNTTLLEEINRFRQQYAHDIELSSVYTNKQTTIFRGKLDSNRQKVGYGEFYQNQHVYFGKFQDDLLHGYGLAIKDENQYYRGNFKNGLFHGSGKQYGPNYEFQGEFQDGVRKKGVFKNNHFQYHGEFKENTFHGQGKIMFTNGASYQGTFIKGKFEGDGILALQNGKYYKGGFKQGKFQGKMKWMQGAKKQRKQKKSDRLRNTSKIQSYTSITNQREMTEITKTIKQNSRIAELSNKLVHHPKKVDLYVYI